MLLCMHYKPHVLWVPFQELVSADHSYWNKQFRSEINTPSFQNKHPDSYWQKHNTEQNLLLVTVYG